MGNIWLKVKIWTKVILLGAVVAYVIVFTYKNATDSVRFWYWYNHQPKTSVLLLALFSFLAGVVGTLLVKTTFSTVRQVRELKDRQRAQRLDRTIADMQAKAAMLRSKPPTGESNGKQSGEEAESHEGA